jgi:anhydro-N-acetylmuramic acid kinase
MPVRSLSSLSAPSTRIVAGLMSGTSLDGVDAVVVRLDGSGPSMTMETLAFVHRAYPAALRNLLLRNSSPDTSSVADLARLNARLPLAYTAAVDDALADAGLERDDLDLVGSHGQTVQHLPEPADCAGASVRATLQIGDPSALAQHLNTPVVGNFRADDVALGGQGAPLAPYFDYVAFTDPDDARGLLNLGGIANLTLLPAGAEPDDVRAFDTGPANMVIDALAERLFDQPYDPDGTHAAAGTPNHSLLADLLMDDYFQQPPPKSTGREHFGGNFVDELLRRATVQDLSPEDTIATATLLTASSVYKAYAQHLRADQPLDALIASGGGIHNDTLMRMLADAFAPIPVHTTDRYGVDPDAKEALCFAVLAHETLNGVPSNLPSVTGASRRAILGSISVP